jgi:hypothetical protein
MVFLLAISGIASAQGDGPTNKELGESLNILWLLLAGFLVFFMQAGFALVETGFTRAKNVSHTMMMNMMVFCIGAVGYWLVGFGLQFGAAYVKATGRIQSLRSNLVATETETIPLPTVGTEFRVFPIPGSQRLSFSGEARGLSVGRYGSFLQYHLEGGVYIFRGLTVRGGYRVLDVDVHTPDRETMFSPRLAGPVISLEFRDR